MASVRSPPRSATSCSRPARGERGAHLAEEVVVAGGAMAVPGRALPAGRLERQERVDRSGLARDDLEAHRRALLGLEARPLAPQLAPALGRQRRLDVVVLRAAGAAPRAPTRCQTIRRSAAPAALSARRGTRSGTSAARRRSAREQRAPAPRPRAPARQQRRAEEAVRVHPGRVRRASASRASARGRTAGAMPIHSPPLLGHEQPHAAPPAGGAPPAARSSGSKNGFGSAARAARSRQRVDVRLRRAAARASRDATRR